VEKQDLPFLSTAELSELIRQKEVSPVEVTESYLERIDDLNFKFNSYLTVCRKEALQAAQQAEQAGTCRAGFQVSNLDEFHDRMTRKNVPCAQPPTETFGVWIAQYVDPDGLIFSVSGSRAPQ